MSYTYSDYVTLTDPVAREARLRLYIQEIEGKETADLSASGRSRSSSPLTAKLERLYRQLAELEAQNGSARGSIVSRSDLRD